jgi:hypothetical protein
MFLITVETDAALQQIFCKEGFGDTFYRESPSDIENTVTLKAVAMYLARLIASIFRSIVSLETTALCILCLRPEVYRTPYRITLISKDVATPRVHLCR